MMLVTAFRFCKSGFVSLSKNSGKLLYFISELRLRPNFIGI